MKKYIITEDQLGNLFNYLKKRPFEEVHLGIQVLSNLPELKESKNILPEKEEKRA